MKKKIKGFFDEFKKFITRGNVVDMAIGVIVGTAFTAIVNGLSNFILKPLINYLLFLVLGSESLSDIFTMLVPGYDETGAIDLASSIYIDWGAFINAIINFFLVASVLFVILKVFNRFKEEQEKWIKAIENGKLTREDRKELKARGIKITNKKAVAEYLEEKLARIKAAEEAAKALEAEKARLEREANPTAEDLLKLILMELKRNGNGEIIENAPSETETEVKEEASV